MITQRCLCKSLVTCANYYGGYSNCIYYKARTVTKFSYYGDNCPSQNSTSYGPSKLFNLCCDAFGSNKNDIASFQSCICSNYVPNSDGTGTYVGCFPQEFVEGRFGIYNFTYTGKSTGVCLVDKNQNITKCPLTGSFVRKLCGTQQNCLRSNCNVNMIMHTCTHPKRSSSECLYKKCYYIPINV